MTKEGIKNRELMVKDWMVRPRVGYLKIIDRFLKETEKELRIEKVVLYGSYAKSGRNKWSDIDVAVISEDFKDIEPFDRLVKLGLISWHAHTTQIEAVGYTPEEYDGASRLDFADEIRRTGKVIYKI